MIQPYLRVESVLSILALFKKFKSVFKPGKGLNKIRCKARLYRLAFYGKICLS